MTDTRQMRSVSESRMANEGQANAGGQRRVDDSGKPYYDQAPLSEYPRMLYRQTEVEQVQEEAAEVIPGLKDLPTVINRFGGLLCDTCIAHSLTEAEALSELGWETSPAAAYGQTEGIAKQASAKDDEIARLTAELASMKSQGSEPPIEKRGPGRPPRQTDI